MSSLLSIETDAACGSGFVLNEEIVVTNEHVIKGAKKIYIAISSAKLEEIGKEGQYYRTEVTEVIACDPKKRPGPPPCPRLESTGIEHCEKKLRSPRQNQNKARPNE
jgi:hypothetical protein